MSVKINEVLRTKYTIDFVFCYIIFRLGRILTNVALPAKRFVEAT